MANAARRRLTRLPFAAADASRRIRSPLFWRALYRLLAWRPVIVAAAFAVRVAGDRGRRALDAFAIAFVWSGWPHYTAGWLNLDASRFRQRVAYAADGPHRLPPRSRLRRGDRLVVGCLGQMSGLLTFPRLAFEEVPQELELHAFDQEFGGRHADYLEPLVARYDALPAPGEGALDDVDVDLLLFVSDKLSTARLLDGSRAGCVAQICAGSDLLHHPRVDFAVYCQPQADYPLFGERLFCATSESWFDAPPTYPGFILYDLRGLDPGAAPGYPHRSPLILVHGSLYKAAAAPFLAVVLGLLRDDPQLELALMGKDDGVALERIRGAARAAGVERRVHYEGEFRAVRNDDGDIDAGGWQRLRDLLATARLAPDPWPVGGGGARVEAYAAGVPTVHLGVRFDREAWRKPQHAIVELPDLLVPEATAADPAAYADLCRRCLYDAEFAAAVTARQARIAARVSDPIAFWRQVVDLYDGWSGR